MKLKIYRAKYAKKLTLALDIDGKSVFIGFGGGDKYLNKNASYSTSNPVIQKALEKDKGFNTLYYLEDTILLPNVDLKEPKELENPNAPDGIEKPFEFQNFNELRDFLIKQKGLAPITVSTIKKAENAMEKLGLKFIIV